MNNLRLTVSAAILALACTFSLPAVSAPYFDCSRKPPGGDAAWDIECGVPEVQVTRSQTGDPGGACSAVISGAMRGPPPADEFRGWSFGDACFFYFPGGHTAERERYGNKCRGLGANFIEFVPDFGSGKNICVFNPSKYKINQNNSAKVINKPLENEKPIEVTGSKQDVVDFLKSSLLAIEAREYKKSYDDAEKAAVIYFRNVRSKNGPDDQLEKALNCRRSMVIMLAAIAKLPIRGNDSPRNEMGFLTSDCANYSNIKDEYGKYLELIVKKTQWPYDSNTWDRWPEQIKTLTGGDLLRQFDWDGKDPYPENYCKDDFFENNFPVVATCRSYIVGSVTNIKPFMPGLYEQNGDPDWAFLSQYWRTGNQFFFPADACGGGRSETEARGSATVASVTYAEAKSKEWDLKLREKFRPSLAFLREKQLTQCRIVRGEH